MWFVIKRRIKGSGRRKSRVTHFCSQVVTSVRIHPYFIDKRTEYEESKKKLEEKPKELLFDLCLKPWFTRETRNRLKTLSVSLLLPFSVCLFKENRGKGFFTLEKRRLRSCVCCWEKKRKEKGKQMRSADQQDPGKHWSEGIMRAILSFDDGNNHDTFEEKASWNLFLLFFLPFHTSFWLNSCLEFICSFNTTQTTKHSRRKSRKEMQPLLPLDQPRKTKTRTEVQQ